MNIFLCLNLRFPEDSAFGAATLSNPRLLLAFAWVVIGTLLMTETGVLRQMFHTTSLSLDQWGICLTPGIALLIFGEIFKAIVRARARSRAVA